MRDGLPAQINFKFVVEICLGQLHVIERQLRHGALHQIERIDLRGHVAEAAICAHQAHRRVTAWRSAPHSGLGRGAFDSRLGGFTRALGRLLAAEFKAGKEGVPLGIDAGGIALPLLIKRFELRAIFSRSSVGPGDALIIRGQVNPVGHDGHRTFHLRVFGSHWQSQWRTKQAAFRLAKLIVKLGAISQRESYFIGATRK